MKTLSERIQQCLEQHRQQLANTQILLDHEMKSELDNREEFCVAAHRIITEIIRPRLEELSRHFENATLVASSSSYDTSCFCSFAHSLQFPATVTLRLSLVPGEFPTEFTAHYDLEIFPILMEFSRSDSLQASFRGVDESIIQWLDDKLLEFLDTYLKIETHPLYQKDNLVLDPVCGMRIPLIAAPCHTEHDGKVVYFCSEHCRDAFLKEKQPQFERSQHETF